MSNPVNGVAVNFGFQGTGGITIAGVTGLLQTADQQAVADCDVTRDGLGAEAIHAWYNDHDESTLEWVITGTGLAAAITNTALLRPGAFISVTACTSMPGLIGTWEAQSSVKISGKNTDSKKFTLPIKLLAGIKTAAGA